jgi:hypothetical protein
MHVGLCELHAANTQPFRTGGLARASPQLTPIGEKRMHNELGEADDNPLLQGSEKHLYCCAK